jgi:steroid delta-isomerase-like uncharacterized protein
VSEENKALVRRLVAEVWNAGDLDVIDELLAPEWVRHDPAAPEELRGPDGFRRFVEMYRSAFPDIRFTVEDQVAEGDKVATRWSAVGTHQEELMGMPPSGNRAEVTGITLERISGGKFVESWDQHDALGMMRQLGFVPESESPWSRATRGPRERA